MTEKQKEIINKLRFELGTLKILLKKNIKKNKMVRKDIDEEELEETEEAEEQEIPKQKVREEKTADRIIEVEITLTLLNQKLNYVIAKLEEISKKV